MHRDRRLAELKRLGRKDVRKSVNAKSVGRHQGNLCVEPDAHGLGSNCVLTRKSEGWIASVLLCAAAVWLAGCRDRSSDTPTAGPVSPTPNRPRPFCLSSTTDAHSGPSQPDAYRPSGLSTTHAHCGPGQSDADCDRPSGLSIAHSHSGPGQPNTISNFGRHVIL